MTKCTRVLFSFLLLSIIFVYGSKHKSPKLFKVLNISYIYIRHRINNDRIKCGLFHLKNVVIYMYIFHTNKSVDCLWAFCDKVHDCSIVPYDL